MRGYVFSFLLAYPTASDFFLQFVWILVSLSVLFPIVLLVSLSVSPRFVSVQSLAHAVPLLRMLW